MIDTYELVDQLTSSVAKQADNVRHLNDFAYELGWKPSYQFELPGTEEFVSGNLVVEHGLQNSAVITFLRRPARFENLEFSQKKSLLTASYNNLIDWHIAVDLDNVNFVHNRIDPPRFYIERRRLARDRTDELTVPTFEALSSKHPSPNVPSLDTAVVKTISFWKRALQTELPGLSNENISALFNGVILGRALEDHFRPVAGNEYFTLRRAASIGGFQKFRDLLAASFDTYPVDIPESLWNPEALSAFDRLEIATVRELVGDFYRNRFEHYFDYDFSIMSKHALSRIYEHYVSLLRSPEQQHQNTLFPQLPEEVRERSFGNVFTPEFVARFFSKYVRTAMPLQRFQRTQIGDPACGSGIFLRSMIEMKAESLFEDRTTRNVAGLFQSVAGIDVDANACASARLSLSLLSLVLTNAFPVQLDIKQDDALSVVPGSTTLFQSLDVVVANPPFVKTEDLSVETRELLSTVLGGAYKGKPDLYLGILKLSIDLLKEGGYGCFVLPKNFLISENAASIRSKLLECAEVKCVVDLSSVRVFEDVGAYVILLIFQRTASPNNAAPVLAVHCTDLIGQGLEDALQEKITRTPAYQVYWSTQPKPTDAIWTFPTPERVSLQSKLTGFSKLSDWVEIRQGVISGADDVFIIPSGNVPRSEREIYLPFLQDRDMDPYTVPLRASRYFFFPFEGELPLSRHRLEQAYPKTWSYLLEHKDQLEKRKSIKSKSEWWRPSWPREPQMLLRPKIVTPHLVISPRFAWDESGKYAVSHTPYFVPKSANGRAEYLYLLAVLNSTTCFWLITQATHNYSRGYSRLEVSTLKNVPAPAVSEVPPELFREIVRLTESRLTSPSHEARELERIIDDRVAEAYRLDESERLLVGLGLFA